MKKAARKLTRARLKFLFDYDISTGVLRRLHYDDGRIPPTEGRIVGGSRTLHGNNYGVIRVDGARYKTHHLVWLYMTGALPDGVIDHIDGNRQNNAFANLRLGTQAQNRQNIKAAPLNSKTGLLGATPFRNGYLARIHIKAQRNIVCKVAC